MGWKDIIWYTTRQADGSYTVTAKAIDHENADGKYEAQVFMGTLIQNKFVKKALLITKSPVQPAISSDPKNNNKGYRHLDVIIKDAHSPKWVQIVQVPTWSDIQDDIRW